MENNNKTGYLYCLFNEMFKYYGNNFFKLGGTKDMDQRSISYTTPYLKKSKIKHLSNQVNNWKLAEKILFFMLRDKRCQYNREFFICDLDKIILTIDSIIEEVNTFDNDILRDIYFKKKIKKINEDIITKEDILKAKDVTDKEFLILSQQKGLNKQEKAILKRYNFKQIWKQTVITENFLDENYEKTAILARLKYFITGDEKLIRTEESHDKIIKNTKTIKLILKCLGYTDLIKSEKISRDVFRQNMETVIDNFEVLTKNRNNLKSIKSFLGFMNAILKEWALMIKMERTIFQLKENGKWKTVADIKYGIEYINKMDMYI